jgi:hypothetical protein
MSTPPPSHFDPFRRLPGSVRTAAGAEALWWAWLPRISAWGTLLPLAAAGAADWWLAPPAQEAMRWASIAAGVVVLHWALVLTLAFGCVIVRVMKGPAFVADAYPLPEERGPT